MEKTDGDRTVLLASLGAGSYGQSYYHLEGSYADKTRLGFKALSELLGIPFEQILVFGTEPQPEHNLNRGSDWSIVNEEFGRELEAYQRRVVNFGMNTPEHYAMFAELVEVVRGKERILVDITHGFRSFPVILLMSLFFADAVDEETTPEIRIFYGAYEAGEDTDETDPFDPWNKRMVKKVALVELPIVPELLSWTKGAERLIKFGIASDLAELSDSKELNPMSKRFDGLHQHLAYNAIHQIPGQAKEVREEFNRKKKKIKKEHPLHYLKEPVDQVLEAFQAERPGQRQYQAAEYFLKAGRYGQAAVAMKEYLISLLTESKLAEEGKDISMASNTGERKWPEKVIGLLDQYDHKEDVWQKRSGELKDLISDWNVEVADQLQKDSRTLTEIRNTFAHGKNVPGLSNKHRDLVTIIQQAEEWKVLLDASVCSWIEFIQPFYQED